MAKYYSNACYTIFLTFNFFMILCNYNVKSTSVPGPVSETFPSFSGQCPTNMSLYPADDDSRAWICDCEAKFLYHADDDSCYQAYTQGPCPVHQYLILPKDKSIASCEDNPCVDEGLVPYNGTCLPLRVLMGSCAPQGTVRVNSDNLKLELDNQPIWSVASMRGEYFWQNKFIKECPPGSRRNYKNICDK